MTRGWFDAFRENGGPTLYSYSNRTAVTADVATLTLYIVFVTLFLAFVIIFPGVRRQRFTTFTSVTLSLFVGTAILGEFEPANNSVPFPFPHSQTKYASEPLICL